MTIPSATASDPHIGSAPVTSDIFGTPASLPHADRVTATTDTRDLR
ncbi:hypothetical protein [Streptomyces sp. LN785]